MNEITEPFAYVQDPLLQVVSPAAAWERDAAKRALDELFSYASRYRSRREFKRLLEFIRRFRMYSPFNAMLAHIQMPGARYVAPAHRWLGDYGRRVRPGARPLIILQPRGPVMFVFDVSQTIPDPNAPPLPPEIEDPFAVVGGSADRELIRTIENAKRDGVFVGTYEPGSQAAGVLIRSVVGEPLEMVFVRRRQGKTVREVKKVARQYAILLDAKHPAEAQYATLAHELGHLYCGHLGTLNPEWWPDRNGLEKQVMEFEAESVSYLVCSRLGLKRASDYYLATHLGKLSKEIPPISLDRVMAAAGLIEQMGQGRLELRPEKKP